MNKGRPQVSQQLKSLFNLKGNVNVINNNQQEHSSGKSKLSQIFGQKKQKIPYDIPKINLKGEKQNIYANPEASPGAIERQLYKLDTGPRMLPRKQRFKAWFALIMVGGWFVGCFALIAYRLRSDDLELMEREVYEELQKKKEVERFMSSQRRESLQSILAEQNLSDEVKKEGSAGV